MGKEIIAKNKKSNVTKQANQPPAQTGTSTKHDQVALDNGGEKRMRLPLAKIKCDRGIQPRVATDKTVVADYAERIDAGDKLPLVVVYFDGTTYWLAEGFHRLAAHKLAGHKTVECIVIKGTREDAQWHALQSNKSHGLRRTNEDKVRTVKLALAHPKGKELTDRQIADLVGVSPTLVGKHRPKDQSTVHAGQSRKRKGRDGRWIETVNIGKRKATSGTNPESGITEAPSPPTSGATGQEQGGAGDDHGPDDHGDSRNIPEPQVPEPGDGVDADKQDALCSILGEIGLPGAALGFESECSEDLIDGVEWALDDIQQTVAMIFDHKEVAALPENHHFVVFLGWLETATEIASTWLASRRVQPDQATLPVANDPEEIKEPAQDNADEEMGEWTD